MPQAHLRYPNMLGPPRSQTLVGRSDHLNLRYLSFICLCAALGGLLFGFDLAVVSGTVTGVKQQFALDHWLEGLFVSSALLGCVFGSSLAGRASDWLGRKNVLMISSLLFVATGLGCAVSPNAPSLLTFRFMGGVGIGIASMVCPLYISEVSPARLRGRLVSLFQFAIAIGICASLLCNAALERLPLLVAGGASDSVFHWMFVDQSWRAMFFTATIPATLFALIVPFIPESPRWLVMVGRVSRAEQILARIEGDLAAIDSLQSIRAALDTDSGTYQDLFRPGWRKALALAVFLALVSECSGITVVLYYGPDILNRAGIQLSDAINGYVIIGIVKMLFTLVALWLIDRSGRRPLLLWGSIGCCAALVSLGFLFALDQTNAFLFVALICVFCAFFAFSLGPIKWVFMSEAFPTRIRARAIGICATTVWAADSFTNYLFPWMRDNWGAAACFFAFALALVPQVFVVKFVMPETSRHTLEEIEQLFVAAAAVSTQRRAVDGV